MSDSVAIVGDRQLLAALEELPARAQSRVLKPLLRAGSRQVASAVRSEAPKQSGLLQTAVGSSPLKNYRSGVLFITAGVRRGFKRAVAARAGRLRVLGKRKSSESPDLPSQDPAKYLHLVAGGRKAVQALDKKVLYDRRTGRFFGRQAAAAAPNPFVSRAFDRSKDAVLREISDQATDAILREAAGMLPK